MKTGIIVTATGIVIMLMTLCASEGYESQLGFLGSFHQMVIVIDRGTYVKYPGELSGYYVGGVTLPVKFPFVIGLIVTAVGIVQIFRTRS